MYNMIMYNAQLSELLSYNKQSHFYSLISVLRREDSALAHCHDLLGSWECGLFKFRTPQAVSGSAAGCRRVPTARPGTGGMSLAPQRFAFFYSPEQVLRTCTGFSFPMCCLGKELLGDKPQASGSHKLLGKPHQTTGKSEENRIRMQEA